MTSVWAVTRKKTRTIIGIMSGTSGDGVDIAIVRITGSSLATKFRVISYSTYPFDQEIKNALFELFDEASYSAQKLCLMNYVLGEVFADAALREVKRADMTMDDIDAVASAGQTVFHMPVPEQVGKIRTRATLQIGEPTVIAERTRKVTVAYFYPRDVASGGQGAPLSGFGDYIIYRDPVKSRAIQNIGGIANVTLIPAGAKWDDLIGFDTGPGNMLIDCVTKLATGGTQAYDKDGRLAASGRVDPELLGRLMDDPYLKMRPPKTTGRERYGEQYGKEVYAAGISMGLTPADIVATVTAFTAETIACSYERFFPKGLRPDEVVVGGGGALNPVLMDHLKRRLPYAAVKTHEDFGIPGKAKEALYTALMANETLSGGAANVPSITGASRRVPLGVVVPA